MLMTDLFMRYATGEPAQLRRIHAIVQERFPCFNTSLGELNSFWVNHLVPHLESAPFDANHTSILLNLFIKYGPQTWTRMNLNLTEMFQDFESLQIQYHVLKQLKATKIHMDITAPHHLLARAQDVALARAFLQSYSTGESSIPPFNAFLYFEAVLGISFDVPQVA